MDTTPARGEVSAGILRVGGCDVNPLPLSRQNPPPPPRPLAAPVSPRGGARLARDGVDVNGLSAGMTDGRGTALPVPSRSGKRCPAGSELRCSIPAAPDPEPPIRAAPALRGSLPSPSIPQSRRPPPGPAAARDARGRCGPAGSRSAAPRGHSPTAAAAAAAARARSSPRPRRVLGAAGGGAPTERAAAERGWRSRGARSRWGQPEGGRGSPPCPRRCGARAHRPDPRRRRTEPAPTAQSPRAATLTLLAPSGP